MSSFSNGERLCTKWLNSFANRVVERSLWKHDKLYLSGRACIEKVRGSVEFFFAFSFVICRFIANSWVLWCSLILDDHFLLVFGLLSISCASICVEFEIQTLCTWSCQCTHQRGDWETKWFVPWFICVMSNWLVLVWIWIRHILVELTHIELVGVEKRICLSREV
jgi:hypothetical protein